LCGAGALVRDLELQSSHRRRIIVRVDLSSILMGEDIPVVFSAHGNAGSFRGVSGAPLGHVERDLPEIGRDLLLFPLALVVTPLVAPADLHAGIPLALV